ncbi:MAG: response regulator [Armatimonadia bacterium]
MSILRECTIGAGKRALVVDDEPVVGQIICRVLEQMGYEVDHALDGDQALRLARSNPYAVVVCDILMPRINGMALYDTWQREAPEIAAHTIFVTGDSLGSETSDFIERTGCPCIFKPFRLNDLAKLVVELESAKV